MQNLAIKYFFGIYPKIESFLPYAFLSGQYLDLLTSMGHYWIIYLTVMVILQIR